MSGDMLSAFGLGHQRKNTFPRIVGRFVSGRPLDGVPRSNSTFLRPGTRVVGQPHRDRPSKWSALPGWKRAAWRMGITTPTVGTGVGLWLAPLPTIVADASITAALSAWGTYKARQAIQTRAHNRTWVRPLHAVLAPALGYDSTVRPDDYLTIPPSIHTDPDTQMSVRLPETFEGDQMSRQRVASIIKTKLALEDATVSWHLSGADRHVLVKQAPKPPARITWQDSLPLIAEAAESAPLIGLGKRGKRIAVDLDSDSPHILVSMSTGGGKSTLVRAIAAQILANGGRVVVCDIKRVSHRWLRGIPGVTYARSPEEIHDALIMVAQEGSRRFEMIDEDRDEEVAALPRVLLVVEEMNATIGKVSRYWAAIRDKEDPKTSPAIEAFGDVLFMGRQARTHVIAVGQLMTARAMGGPEMRECFSTRILARYSQNAWKMLVPEIWPMPKTTRHAGRVQLVQAGEAHETQVLYGTEEEARTLALSGRPADRVPSPTASLGGDRYQGNGVGTVPRDAPAGPPVLTLVKGSGQGPFQIDPNAPVGLKKAAETVLSGLSDTPEKSLEVLRAARKRDPEFPLPVQERGQEKLYLPSELIRWSRNRPSAVG